MRRRTFIIKRLLAIPCLAFPVTMAQAMLAPASGPEVGMPSFPVSQLLREFVEWAEQVHGSGPVGSDFEIVLPPALALQIASVVGKAMVEPVTLFTGNIPPRTVAGAMIFHEVGFGIESVFSGKVMDNDCRYNTLLRCLSRAARTKLLLVKGSAPCFRSTLDKFSGDLRWSGDIHEGVVELPNPGAGWFGVESRVPELTSNTYALA
jgi:hypothetical protein